MIARANLAKAVELEQEEMHLRRAADLLAKGDSYFSITVAVGSIVYPEEHEFDLDTTPEFCVMIRAAIDAKLAKVKAELKTLGVE